MSQVRNDERRLVRFYHALGSAERDILLAFGEFLASRGATQGQGVPEPLEPTPIPRPQEERVVGAIKRLSRTFYMLDRGAMLNDTSSLMGAHILQGRPASAVIDELEDLFARRYAEYREVDLPTDV